MIGPTWWLNSTAMFQYSRHLDRNHRLCTYSLSLESYTVQLHNVWAQNITWDWMWCSTYCREKRKKKEKSLIVIVHFVIFISYDFFLRIFIMTVLLFFKFVFIYLGFLAVLSNKTMFICFFGEPLLKYDIVTFFILSLTVHFGAFFFSFFLKENCFIVITYALSVGCYLILITDVQLVS